MIVTNNFIVFIMARKLSKHFAYINTFNPRDGGILQVDITFRHRMGE
jgi:hypothetical protein